MGCEVLQRDVLPGRGHGEVRQRHSLEQREHYGRKAVQVIRREPGSLGSKLQLGVAEFRYPGDPEGREGWIRGLHRSDRRSVSSLELERPKVCRLQRRGSTCYSRVGSRGSAVGSVVPACVERAYQEASTLRARHCKSLTNTSLSGLDLGKRLQDKRLGTLGPLVSWC